MERITAKQAVASPYDYIIFRSSLGKVTWNTRGLMDYLIGMRLAEVPHGIRGHDRIWIGRDPYPSPEIWVISEQDLKYSPITLTIKNWEERKDLLGIK